jgi:hypothetical protein
MRIQTTDFGSRITMIAAKFVKDASQLASPKRFSGSSWWQIKAVRTVKGRRN